MTIYEMENSIYDQLYKQVGQKIGFRKKQEIVRETICEALKEYSGGKTVRTDTRKPHYIYEMSYGADKNLEELAKNLEWSVVEGISPLNSFTDYNSKKYYRFRSWCNKNRTNHYNAVVCGRHSTIIVFENNTDAVNFARKFKLKVRL